MYISKYCTTKQLNLIIREIDEKMAGIKGWLKSLGKRQTKEGKKTEDNKLEELKSDEANKLEELKSDEANSEQKNSSNTQIDTNASDNQRLKTNKDDDPKMKGKSEKISKRIDKPVAATNNTWVVNIKNLQGEAKIGNSEFIDNRISKTDGSGDYNVVNKGNTIKVFGDAEFAFTKYIQHESATATSGKIPRVLNENNDVEIRPSSKGEGGSGQNKVVMTQVVKK